MSNSIVLDAGLQYAARGWLVFPLGPNSKAPHPELPKMPQGKGGPYLATTDLDQIIDWFTQWPDANIGIACGATNGHNGPWVLDPDNKQGKTGSDDLQALERQHGELPDTPIVHTANNGEHRYFANDPRTAVKVNGKLYGHASIDIQGTGCYIVAPPSIVDGKPYLEDANFPFATTRLAIIPQWVLDGVADRAPDVEPAPPSEKPIDEAAGLAISKPMQTLLIYGDVLGKYLTPDKKETDTSKMLAALEGALIREGYGDEDIVTLLMNPQHEGGAKARKQGAAWLRKDIGRMRGQDATTKKKPTAKSTTNSTPPPRDPTEPQIEEEGSSQGFHLTDYGNAERFVAQHGHRLRYCHKWNKWLHWTGKYWEKDENGRAIQYAKQTVRQIYREAADCEEDIERRVIAKWAKQSEATSKIHAFLTSAQSEPGIPVDPLELDTNFWLLNCANGTLNLKTGELSPHDPAQLITRYIPIAYNPKATAPLWESFLARIIKDESVRQFLQRLAGNAITGDTTERLFLVLYGAGRNGKTTFLETLAAVLGDAGKLGYTSTLSTTAITEAKRYPGAPSPEIARLRGARLVWASEARKRAALNEALVKQLTGNDTMDARGLHENTFSFKPQFTFFFMTNNKPRIADTTDSIWDRVKLIPFTERISDDERDTTLGNRLLDELPGVLNWMVTGCQDWLRNGLGEPEAVKQATEEYRVEEDTIKQFIQDMCLESNQVRAGAQLLYDAYKGWIGRNTIQKPDNSTAFKAAMETMGFPWKKTNSGRYFEGIGLYQSQSPSQKPDTDTRDYKASSYDDSEKKVSGSVGENRVFSAAIPREEKPGKTRHCPTPDTKGSDKSVVDGEKEPENSSVKAIDIPLAIECIFGACEGTARLQFTSWKCPLCNKTWPHQFNLTQEQFRQLTQ